MSEETRRCTEVQAIGLLAHFLAFIQSQSAVDRKTYARTHKLNQLSFALFSK